MRVIYVVRAAQLLITLRALWILYSVSAFCEKTQHTMAACSDMIARIPFATPEQIAEHERIKQQRPASNRSDASTTTPIHDSTTTTTRASTSTESSTVTGSTTVTSSEEVKIRKKRDERRELPGNGMTEAQRKAAAVETKKEEEKKVEVKKEEEKKETQKVEETTPVPILKEHHEEKKEEKKVEKREKKKEEVKVEEKKEEKKEEVKVEASTPAAVKKEDKKEQYVEKKEEQKPAQPKVDKSEVNTTEKKGETTTANPSKKEEKEQIGAKVEIPVAAKPQKEEQKPAEKPATNEADHAPSPSEERHHTVKKDLKAHVQEPVELPAAKESTTRAPKPVQEKFVLEHSDTFLQEIRCLEVTSDDYFGKDISPFAAHLKGLAIVGPVLVVVAIYLVCSVLRTRLGAEPPTEFTDRLWSIFHLGMWFVIGLSMYFIADHWTQNWQSVSANTFMPEFPCPWFNLILLSSLMVLATTIEMCFYKQLYSDIVFERSYGVYEVIERTDADQHENTFSRTNVY